MIPLFEYQEKIPPPRVLEEVKMLSLQSPFVLTFIVLPAYLPVAAKLEGRAKNSAGQIVTTTFQP